MKVFGALAATCLLAGAACHDPAVAPRCVTDETLSIGTTASDGLGGNCVVSDSLQGNSYKFLLPEPAVIRLDLLASAAVDLNISDLARSISSRSLVVEPGLSKRSLYVSLPAGIFTAFVTGKQAATYTIGLKSASTTDLAGCARFMANEPVYVVPEAALPGALGPGDCTDASGHYLDYVVAYLPANGQHSIVVNGNAGMAVAINDNGAPVAGQSSDVGGVAVRFTPSRSGLYVVTISTKAPSTTASYTIRVD